VDAYIRSIFNHKSLRRTSLELSLLCSQGHKTCTHTTHYILSNSPSSPLLPPPPHPNAGASAYPTTNSSPCLKHYNTYHKLAHLPPKSLKNNTYRPQIPHALIQRRRKNTPHIAKHTLMLLQPQFLAQKPHNRVEALVCRELEHALGKVWCRSDGLESDCYFEEGC
jgi:hypothetical protein